MQFEFSQAPTRTLHPCLEKQVVLGTAPGGVWAGAHHRPDKAPTHAAPGVKVFGGAGYIHPLSSQSWFKLPQQQHPGSSFFGFTRFVFWFHKIFTGSIDRTR